MTAKLHNARLMRSLGCERSSPLPSWVKGLTQWKHPLGALHWTNDSKHADLELTVHHLMRHYANRQLRELNNRQGLALSAMTTANEGAIIERLTQAKA